MPKYLFVTRDAGKDPLKFRRNLNWIYRPDQRKMLSGRNDRNFMYKIKAAAVSKGNFRGVTLISTLLKQATSNLYCVCSRTGRERVIPEGIIVSVLVNIINGSM